MIINSTNYSPIIIMSMNNFCHGTNHYYLVQLYDEAYYTTSLSFSTLYSFD